MININRQLHFSSHMGRMGNQMFQYACAKNLELKYGYTCSLDDLSQLKYFELAEGERWKNKLKAKFFFHLVKRIKGMEICNLQFDDMLNDYTNWIQSLKRPAMIWGFFQSERYFKQSSNQIKSYFKVKAEYQERFHQFLAGNNLQKGCYSAVHIRRTDYKGFNVIGLSGDDFTLPESYYNHTIELMNSETPVVVVSDDPDFCKEKFKDNKRIIISSEDSITDFQLLTNAQELVISNSTFAWWAAWMNPFAEKIICPKFFLGFKEEKEVPVNIYPDHWRQYTVS